MKRLSSLEVWCWYLAGSLAVLALLQDTLPMWARALLAVAVLVQTRWTQLDNRREARHARSWR